MRAVLTENKKTIKKEENQLAELTQVGESLYFHKFLARRHG